MLCPIMDTLRALAQSVLLDELNWTRFKADKHVLVPPGHALCIK